MRHYLDLLSEAVRDNWDRPALSDCSLLFGEGGREYTYGGMYRQIVSLERLLVSSGLHDGDHVAICGANSANWMIAYLALAACRCVSVPVLHSQPQTAVASQIAFADCKALFVDSDIWKDVDRKGMPALEQVFSLDDFSVLEGEPLPVVESFSHIGKDDVGFDLGPLEDLAQICFTSGSTDGPKAVMLSFRNISNNVRDAIETSPEGRNLTVLSTLPLAHIYGLLDEVLRHLPDGHHVFFVRQMSINLIKQLLLLVNPYVFVTVPMVLEQMYSRKGSDIAELFGLGLRQIFVGGSKLNDDVETELLSLGLPLTSGYGSTETGPLISASRYDTYKPHSCGQVVSGMEARISGAGEILVRGANVMLGYYKNPEATRRKIDADGWLHTGDRGRVDEDGTVYVYGRLEQDMIVLPSGENIIPQSIESLLDALDGVAESLVIERSGRLVALVRPESVAESPVLERSGRPVAPVRPESRNSPPSADAAESGVCHRDISGFSHDSEVCPLDKVALLRAVNVQLPSFSQLADIEFVTEPFQRTGKSGIKRYLYR